MTNMSITVYVSDRLARRTKKSVKITVEGTTLRDVLEALDRKHPGFKNDIYSPSKEDFRAHITVGINGVARRHLSLDVPLADGDQISFVVALRGGWAHWRRGVGNCL